MAATGSVESNVVADVADVEPALVDLTRPSPTSRSRTTLVLGALGLFLASRLFGLFAALGSTWLEPSLRLSYIYSSWDGYWYLKIAQHGYPATLVSEGGGNRWAFFPGFPMAIRAVKYATSLSYRDSAIFAGLIFGAAAAAAIALMIADVFSAAAALRTVALVVFFPSSFVLGMAYADGMLLALVAAALLAVHRRAWFWAAVLINLACLTRVGGAALIAVMAVEVVRESDTKQRLRIFSATVLSALGIVSWCLYARARTGNLLAFMRAERDWGGAHFVWFEAPFKSVGHLLTRTSAWHGATQVTSGIAVALVLSGYVALVHMHRRDGGVPVSWWVYCLITTVVAFSPFWPSSILRYTLALIPLFAVAAIRARPRAFDALVGGFGVMQGALAVVTWVSLANGHGVTPP